VQRDRDPAQLGELEDVGQQVLGELDAAGADERYLDYLASSVLLRLCLTSRLLKAAAGDALQK
jgi:hypothetical protein